MFDTLLAQRTNVGLKCAEQPHVLFSPLTQPLQIIISSIYLYTYRYKILTSRYMINTGKTL